MSDHMTRLGERLRSEDGFTLAELSVSMAAAVVVLIGLMTIMVVTLHQSQRTFTKVDATRQARTALGTIENELHSACLNGPQSIPIQAGSTGTSLTFLSYYGNNVNPTPTWHVLTFSGTTLTDASYTAVPNPAYDGSGTNAQYLPGAGPTTTTLLTNVYQQKQGAQTLPVFQYFAYAQAGTDSSGDTYMVIPDGTDEAPGSTTPVTTSALTTPLAQTDADNTVEVRINLLVGPTSEKLNNPLLTTLRDPVTDSISLRLTTPPDYVAKGATANGYGPCQ
jgi:hypothetical protein